jgi:two-component system, cell cycle response regulator
VPDVSLPEAAMVAERIRERIGSTPFSVQRGTRSIDVTVSIGLAAIQAGDESAAEIMKRADVALYRAKNEGRNRVIAAAA